MRDALYDCEDAARDAYEAREAAEEGARDAAFALYDADKNKKRLVLLWLLRVPLGPPTKPPKKKRLMRFVVNPERL